MTISLPIFPLPLVLISICVLYYAVAMLLIKAPLSLVLSTCAIVVDAFSVFFSVLERSFVFVLIAVDDLSFVSGLIVDPFPVVHGSTRVLQNTVTVLFVLDPVAYVFIAIRIEIRALPVFLSIQPVSFVLFVICVCENSKSVLFVPLPFALVHCTALVQVDSPSRFLPLLKLSLVLLAIGIGVQSLAMETVLLPVPHVDIFVGKFVDAASVFAVGELADIFGSILIVDFSEFGFDFSGIVEELSQEFLLAVRLGFHAGVGYADSAGVVAGEHHRSNIQLVFKMIITLFYEYLNNLLLCSKISKMKLHVFLLLLLVSLHVEVQGARRSKGMSAPGFSRQRGKMGSSLKSHISALWKGEEEEID